MRLYKFFLLIAIILSFSEGCSLYNKIFKRKVSKPQIENIQKTSAPPTSFESNNLMLEKERYYMRFNVFNNELLIKYSSKAYFQNNDYKGAFGFSLPFHSTILEIKIQNSFTKSYCASSKNLVQLPTVDTSNDVFTKHYILYIQCNEKPEYLDVGAIYSIPLNLISQYTIRNKLYVINIHALLLTHKLNNQDRTKNVHISIKKNYSLFFNEANITRIKPDLYQIQIPEQNKSPLIIAKAKKINTEIPNINIFRIKGRYNLSKIKTVAKLTNKVTSFFRMLFEKKMSNNINLFFHIERFSFAENNNLFLGSDISTDLFSGFMPAKLIRLILKTFYTCNFSTYQDTAIQEYFGDFFLSKEYKTIMTVIRYKKLNVLSSYIYKSIQISSSTEDRYSYLKELKNQLKTFLAYFYLVKRYKDNYLKLANDLIRCNITLPIKKISIPKIAIKTLSNDKSLLVFTKNLKQRYSNIPIKINNQIQNIPLQQSICNGNFCNLFIENVQEIKIDPEYTIVRLLKKSELIPSFQSLSLSGKIKIKIVSKLKRNWAILEEFIKTINKYVEVEYESKKEADLTVVVYERNIKFFEQEAIKELPCIKLSNGILYDKVVLSEQLFGIVSCKYDNRIKTLIFAPTFYHLYLFSAEELKKTSWKSIWIWNKKKLIYSNDILSENQ